MLEECIKEMIANCFETCEFSIPEETDVEIEEEEFEHR